MKKKWIGSLVLCSFVWWTFSSPATAALNQAGFVPCSVGKYRTVSNLTQNYYVRSGDTLWDISRTYHIDLQTLMISNKLDSNSILRVGQRLQIPSDNERVHIIRRGETLWDIAQHYNVKLDELMRLNANQKASNLKIGDKIILPGDIARIAMAGNSSRSIVSRFNWPLRGTITSRYGWRSSGFHHGLDVAGDLGAPIQAAAGGVVSFTGHMSLYGNTVIIDHPDGMQTLYAHLHKIKVKKGERVRSGETIATVGNTGRSTGPHLHFEIRRGSERYDPLAYLH